MDYEQISNLADRAAAGDVMAINEFNALKIPDNPEIPKFILPYRCLGEQILVKRIDLEDEVSPGGVVKPQIARVKSNRGIVVAVGEGRMIGNSFVPFNLEVGDTVLFSRHGGTDVELDGQMYILLHHKMIYMVENAAH